MKNHIHKFSVDSMGPKRGDRPFTPFVQLVLDNHSPSINGHVSLTPRMVSDGEIDANVSLLKKDLDRAAQMAKLTLEQRQGRT